MVRPWEAVIPNVSALVTTREARRQGFLDQALTKVSKASPYIQKVQVLRQALQTMAYDEIIELRTYRAELLSAVGISDKALQHLDDQDRTYVATQALAAIYAESLKEHPEDPLLALQAFRDEIMFRYLLTKGDALGGSMRNLIGSQGSRILVDAVVRTLQQSDAQLNERRNRKGKVDAVIWSNRVLVLDKTPGIFERNNIDAILLNTDARPITDALLRAWQKDPTYYLACGEVKGGIDPAGADEHWKTASSALARIRRVFEAQPHRPRFFYAGAAIEQAMAAEIFGDLENGKLDFAANLAKREQVNALVEWLITL